jgi:hypothetical protein
VVVGLFDADDLAGKHLTEIDFLSIEADAAAGGDRDRFVMERIVEVWQAAIWPWALSPHRIGWCLRSLSSCSQFSFRGWPAGKAAPLGSNETAGPKPLRLAKTAEDPANSQTNYQ